MSKRLYFPTAAVTVILAGLILTTSIRTWAAPPTLISDSGKTLSTVFEGLRANPALRPEQLAKYQPLRRQWQGIGSSRLPGLTRVHFTEGDNCPGTPCTGNYTSFRPQPGGCTQGGCPAPNDFFTDLSAPCDIGEFDSPCFDTVTCCMNAEPCQSPNTVGCPK